ncbi:hypothetical protein CABS01_16113 [Colletotrichum abscissum]|uniref:uncharacterized protein n=1 Tax=Colletotrichum abscissum TaxID=1671311 RepID=UPI0027D5B144|nr:uncharacterized protein CABS01_16113 [Colletotrichum abscissum]KAK1472895.1 hypothetical protein CABS01_16113 [Colletotrichum abscissum]
MPCTMETSEPRAPGKGAERRPGRCTFQVEVTPECRRGEQGRALALRLLCFCCAAAARGTHVPIPLGRRAPYSVRLRLVKYTTLRSLRTHRLGSHPFAYKSKDTLYSVRICTEHRGWQWISLHSVNGYLSDTTCAYRSGSKRSPTAAHHHPFSLRGLTAPDSPICRGTTAPRPWSQP